MPTYQYRCADCGEGLEVQQSFTDDALTVCPACGGQLRKQFGAVGVVFKGSGFYRNDSRSTSTSSSSSSDSSTSSTSDSKKPAASTSTSAGTTASPSASS